MKLVFMGPQASGKGTHSIIVAEKKGWPHISTGDMLREQIEQKTELGKKAQAFVSKGDLVPDDLVVEILKERITRNDCKGGFILDGFPRNLEQAKILDNEIGVDKVVLIDIPDDEVVRRLTGRIQCPKCKAIFGIDKETRPKQAGVCDKCGEKLFQRQDDEIEAIRQRLNIYHRETEPVLKHYEDKGILVRAAGIGKGGEILEKSEVAKKVWKVLFQ